MSFILVPKHGQDIQVNGWNWRPTLELLKSEGLLDEELFECMGAQGCGGKADASLASRMAAVVETKLAGMNAGERMLSDLRVTSGVKQPGDDPYCASYEWLAMFKDFCKCSGGFKVV